MFRRLPLTLGAAALAAATLIPLPPAQAAAPGKRHVVVFGLDGVRWDVLQQVDAPAIKSLIAQGYASQTWLYSSPLAQTSSGPGWATGLTGVWPDKHKVKDNSFSGNDLKSHPDFLTRVEQSSAAFSTYAALDWKPIGDRIITGGIDRKFVLDGDADGYTVDDPKVAADASAHLKNNGPHASFVYFGNPDIAGHDSGGASAAYREAIETADRQIGQVIAAAKSRPTYAEEEWAFVVTTDHGHTDGGGHGGSSWQERQSFVVAAGPGIPHSAPAVKARNVDVAATVLDYLGVARPAAYDGVPVTRTPSDPFDALSGSLKARVDETGIPASTLGWTHAAPSGWRIDTTGLGTGGVTEWRGWSFTNDEFWTSTDRGQDRENNVRARGVFAVADADEWADKSFSGTFNSTLVSAPYDVAGKSGVRLGFSSHYLQEGNQKAEVFVSFDGGADTRVLAYNAHVKAKVENLAVTVPSGARQMTVKWRLSNAGNNWYWAVDAPSVS
ncbi:alkaline phosphatase family protein [Spirillospora sp. CA-294931]|uniref:alkaline phosphatase family protein n=1 Tax=Spirillospora sp. CA-294931 TaxID=3240042 RepID=UPI003D947B9B